MKSYIASPNYLKNYSTYTTYPDVFKPLDKVLIRKIKIDKNRLSYANKVREEEVNEIINNFHIEGWEPIFITPDFYLIDGQHRIAAAQKMNLEFIDVIIINEKGLSFE